MATEPETEPVTEPVTEPSQPTAGQFPDAPGDLDGFDAWARLANDNFQRAALYAETTRRWADTTLSVDQRGLAGIWGAVVGRPSAAEVAPLLEGDALDPVIRARLQATVAVEATGDPDAAVKLVEAADATMNNTEVAIRTRLAVWLMVAEVYARTGRSQDAMGVLDRAGKAVRDAPDAPAWAPMVVDAERLSLVAPVTEDRSQILRAAETVASAARSISPSPASLDVLVKMGALLAAAGDPRKAEPFLEAVVQVTEAVPEARGLRFQAQLVLADVVGAVEGVEAAITAQRNAIETVTPMGDTPMLGWAQRGLGLHLRAAERFSESAEVFDAAVQLYGRLELSREVAAMTLERATSLIFADEPDQARTLTHEVLDGADSLPEDARGALQVRGNEVLAQAAAYDGNLEEAADHWLEVADLGSKLGFSPLDAHLEAARLFAANDDLDEARAQFARAEMAAADEEDPAKATAAVMRAQAETLRDVGEVEEAAEIARIASNHARTSGDEPQAIYLAVIAADALRASGDLQGAVQLYNENLAAAEAASMPMLKGSVHAAFALALREAGRGDEADIHDAEAKRLSVNR